MRNLASAHHRSLTLLNDKGGMCGLSLELGMIASPNTAVGLEVPQVSNPQTGLGVSSAWALARVGDGKQGGSPIHCSVTG
jgi:hypothetical protein